MRKALIQWLARELDAYVAQLIREWIDSGRLADTLRAQAPAVRAQLRDALFALLEGGLPAELALRERRLNPSTGAWEFVD